MNLNSLGWGILSYNPLISDHPPLYNRAYKVLSTLNGLYTNPATPELVRDTSCCSYVKIALMSKERQRWTPAEDAILREGVRQQMTVPKSRNGSIDWNKVAEALSGRNNKDCRKRYNNKVVGTLKKGQWTKEEDERLVGYVKENGLSWSVIAQKMGNRSADQCSKRWHHSLDPVLDRRPWNDQDNDSLLTAVLTHGHSWREIQQRHFPSRAANTVKNQYTILIRKGRTAPENKSPCCSASIQRSLKAAGDDTSSRVSSSDKSLQGISISVDSISDEAEFLFNDNSPFIEQPYFFTNSPDEYSSDPSISGPGIASETPGTPDFNFFDLGPTSNVSEIPNLEYDNFDISVGNSSEDLQALCRFDEEMKDCVLTEFEDHMMVEGDELLAEFNAPESHELCQQPEEKLQDCNLQGKSRVILQLEDLDPSIISQVMDIVVQSKTTVKFYRN